MPFTYSLLRRGIVNLVPAWGKSAKFTSVSVKIIECKWSSYKRLCHLLCEIRMVASLLQGSELSGWALGRYSYEGIDMNHNFADLNNIMWDTQEKEKDKSKVSNHYIPIPEYYTSEDAFVRRSS